MPCATQTDRLRSFEFAKMTIPQMRHRQEAREAKKFEKVDIQWYRGSYPVDIEQGPDGYLYFVEFGKGTLERLVPE